MPVVLTSSRPGSPAQKPSAARIPSTQASRAPPVQSRRMIQRLVVRPRVNGLHHTDMTRGEGRLAIREVVVPFADENVIEPLRPHRVAHPVEVLPPDMQGPGVIRTHIVQVVQEEITRAIERRVDPSDAVEQRAGKNVALNEVGPAPEHLVLRIRTRDVLQPEQPFAREQTVALGEVAVEVTLAHRFQHFDGSDLVEFPAQLAVVLEQHIDLGA